MAEVEPMKIDCSELKRPPKRKRAERCSFSVSPAEKLEKIEKLRSEINSLVKFCKDLVSENRGALLEKMENLSASMNNVVACLIEESDLPLSKLVDDIFEKVKGKSETVSKANVKSTVLMIGQRLCYGVINADADVLEDETDCALWFWETRDLKLVPKLARDTIKARRTCRKKIHERITAILDMVTSLEKSEDHRKWRQEFMKSSEKLVKVLDEADIRLLVQNKLKKNGGELAETESKKEKLLIKQMEKNKREMEKETKKMDRELKMERLQSRHHVKEECDVQKQLKKQQEESKKDQRRKEKEEAELKKRLALLKQASIMERFLNQNKTTSTSKHSSSMKRTSSLESSSRMVERMCDSATLTMDSVLAQSFQADAETIWKLHLKSWRSARSSMHSNRLTCWGLRQKPKTELVKELKLTKNKEPTHDEDSNAENIVDGWLKSTIDRNLSWTNMDELVSSGQKRTRRIQLLQFDKSHRPAFYGVWPRKSQVAGARHPFAKDPDIDYEIDSDEEWKEDEPGESLSDCDKEDEDESMELLNCDDEDESEDGFFVADGYLSENEGVHGGELESDELVEEGSTLADTQKQVQCEELCTLLRQQKHLNNLTEHALKKNHPLIILNLMHEKNTFLPAQDLTAKEKLGQMCLQALCIRPFPGFPVTKISMPNNLGDDLESPPNKFISITLATATAISDSDLPQIIFIIQSCQHSIGKIVEALQDKFPATSKSQLRNKVREISEFSDNRWQVKKEILSRLGLSLSPAKNMSIAAFLKTCAPPP